MDKQTIEYKKETSDSQKLLDQGEEKHPWYIRTFDLIFVEGSNHSISDPINTHDWRNKLENLRNTRNHPYY